MRFLGLTLQDSKLEHIRDEIRSGYAQIIDVREENEWRAGHLQASLFSPLSMLQRGVCPDDIDREKKTYLHCAAGVRVLSAKPILEQMGFREVIALPHRFRKLRAAGL